MEASAGGSAFPVGETRRRQLTLVAWYGEKPQALVGLLKRCQDELRDLIGRLDAGVSFQPYSLAQIHATVLGLERQASSGFENRNFSQFRGSSKAMRLPPLFEYLAACPHLPLDVRFGGFAEQDVSFLSRSARPYERSFSLQGDKAVLIGWPFGTEGYVRKLEAIRRQAETFHVLHRWHERPSDADNDAYLRLGTLSAEVPEDHRDVVTSAMRRILSAAPPVSVRLAASDLAVVAYPADIDTLAA
jgi:hypothetical protein